MAENSKIEWCHHTHNPWWGCSKVAAGCTHCYAEAFAKRTGKAKWGPQGTRVKTSESYWKQPLKWNREAGESGERRRVFCASMADVFEDWTGTVLHHRIDSHGCQLPLSFDVASGDFSQWSPKHNSAAERLATLDDIRRELFALIDATPHLDWLLLTKRPENARRMCPESRQLITEEPENLGPFYRQNVWLGTSIATQADADRNIPLLRACRDLAPVLFLSCEPLIEAVTLDLTGIDWVIVGGESGHGARPCEIEWIKSLIRQSDDAGVRCFVKQLGAVAIERESTVEDVRARRSPEFEWPDGTHFGNGTTNSAFNGRRVLLDDKKGGDWSEWPQDLRVREFPSTERIIQP